MAITHALVAELKTCAIQENLCEGQRVHSDIIKRGSAFMDNFLNSGLVHMYAKCGVLTKAQQVFDELSIRDVISWTALIAAYSQHGHGHEALDCFKWMQEEGLSSNAYTFACVLKACGSIRAAHKGEGFHIEIIKKGFLIDDAVLGTALVDMYGRCGAFARAKHVLDELPTRNVFSWTALIAGYCQHREGERALICFKQMQDEGVSPNQVTLLCALQACGNVGAAEKGEEIHVEIVRGGLLYGSSPLGNALVDMYAKCGAISRAQNAFTEILIKTAVSWNALITGCSEHGHDEKALMCFRSMKSEGFVPDAVTFTCIVKCCGSLKAVEKGREVHAEVVRKELMRKDVVLGNALVDMYLKCHTFARAQEVFDGLSIRDVVSWNVLISGYAQHGHAQVLSCLERMQEEGLSPNAVSLLGILQACGRMGAVDKGHEVHAEIVREGLLGKETSLDSAVVDMYAKCSAMRKAQEVFDKLVVRHVVSWTALIAGYVQVGNFDTVFNLFNKMRIEGVKPTFITFTVLLSACSCLGVVSEGLLFYDTICVSYGLLPAVQHHTCLVDLFGRTGQFDKALTLLKKMPFSNYFPAWMSLLSACGRWGNVKLGKGTFEHVTYKSCGSIL